MNYRLRGAIYSFNNNASLMIVGCHSTLSYIDYIIYLALYFRHVHICIKMGHSEYAITNI